MKYTYTRSERQNDEWPEICTKNFIITEIMPTTVSKIFYKFEKHGIFRNLSRSGRLSVLSYNMKMGRTKFQIQIICLRKMKT